MGRLVSFGLGSAAAQIRPAVEQRIGEIARQVQSFAQQFADDALGTYDSVRTQPSQFAMFEYRNSFVVRTGPRDNVNLVHRQTTSTSPKANLIEFGSRPHTIAPRDADYLAWDSLTGGRVTLPDGVAVHHPGTQAYKILTRAAAAAR